MDNSKSLKCGFLFVYGTLRSGEGAAYKILGNGGAFISTAAKAKGVRHGRIVATFDNNAKTYVDGHLVMLPTDPDVLAKMMNELDAYESVDHKNPDNGAYKRVICDVTIPGHDFTIEAWSYHYNYVRS